jgi:hypothetical protein
MPFRSSLTSGRVRPPTAPVISAAGGVSIGQALTIVDGAGAPTTTRTLYRNGVAAGVVTSGYLFVAADIGPSLTVTPQGPGGTGAASNTLVYAGLIASLSGNTAIFDETAQIGTPIDTWTNQHVGVANDDLTAAGAARPAAGRTINSLAAPDFGGTANQFITGLANSSFVSAAAYHVFAVVELDAVVGTSASGYLNECALVNIGAYWWMGFRENAGAYTVIVGHNAAAVDKQPAAQSISLATPTLIEWWYDGANINLRVGATVATQIAAGNVTLLTHVVRVGSRYNAASNFLDGAIAEIVICNAAQSATVQADARAFLSWKYAVVS